MGFPNVQNVLGPAHPNQVRSALRKRASALARESTEDNIALLVAIRNNKDAGWGLRAQVAFGLLDRGWGRPPQSVSLHFEDDHDPDAIAGLETVPLVARLIEEAISGRSAGGGETHGAGGPLLLVEARTPPEGDRTDTTEG